MKASKKTIVTAPASAVAAVAAAAPVATDAPKGKKGGNPFANMSDDIRALASRALSELQEGFDGIVRSEHEVARMIGSLRAKGYHTLAGYNDFNTWVEDASCGMIPRSKSNRYDAAATVLEACEANADRKAEAVDLSIDTLAKIAGKAKKGSRETAADSRAAHRQTIARQSVAAYSEARSKGTAKDAEVAAGIRDAAPSASATLDFDGQVSQIVNRAYALADNNHADAIRILATALDKAKKAESKAREVAAAQRGKK